MCWKGRIEEIEKVKRSVGCSRGSRGKRVGVEEWVYSERGK